MVQNSEVINMSRKASSTTLIQVAINSNADESITPEKRYVAALAKNGRLPKFVSAQKKDSREMFPTEDPVSYMNDEYPNYHLSEDKRNIGAFFESRGKPNFESVSRNDASDASSGEAKRNVATLARLGRLNAIRYGRLPSRLVSSKRITSEGNKPTKDSNNEDNDIDIFSEADCHDGGEDQMVEVSPNLTQKKRYVAALARSGRLPIWHSQRMWGAGKRDDSYPYGDDSRYNGNDDDFDNVIDETARATPKYKRCKKVYGFEPQKRNIAALAKNGKLPFNNYQDDKRNVQAMARNGKLPSFNRQEEKRNVQAMARNGKLPSFNNQDGKRNIQALARNGKIPSFSYQTEKRNVQALARNGKLPSFSNQDDKRNVQALARNGKLRSFSQQDEKRNVQAMARNGKLPFSSNQEDEKRNIQSLARSGKLLFNGNGKRNIQAMARSGKLLFNSYPNGKRSEESDSDEYEQDSDFIEEKRNLAALARNGKLPFSHQNSKKNIAAMARNGKLLFNTYQNNKRDEDESTWEDMTSSEFQKEKRNIAALARDGKLPEEFYWKNKRNMAAMARNGKLPAYKDDGKRNTESVA
ncbi:neuropeptide-like 1 [Trichonephila clavipes]|nr:neuropeptide-like 1 [Trichonephila clavipes]